MARTALKHIAILLFICCFSMFVAMLVLINGTWMRWEQAERPELQVALILGNRLDDGNLHRHSWHAWKKQKNSTTQNWQTILC
jgi:hypothetical protein